MNILELYLICILKKFQYPDLYSVSYRIFSFQISSHPINFCTLFLDLTKSKLPKISDALALIPTFSFLFFSFFKLLENQSNEFLGTVQHAQRLRGCAQLPLPNSHPHFSSQNKMHELSFHHIKVVGIRDQQPLGPFQDRLTPG